MVSLVNGNPNKQSLENGYHCSSFGNTANYKPRKISAVRDFPRGCGRNAHPIIPEPQQKVLVAVEGVATPVGPNRVCSECQGETQPCEVMKSPIRVVMEADGKIDVGSETNEFRMPVDMEHHEIVVVPIGNGISVVEKANGIETSADAAIQSHEVLGSSVGMEEDISLDHLEGKVVVVVADGMDNQVEERELYVKPIDIGLPKDLERKELNGEEVQTLLTQLDNVESLPPLKHVHEEGVKLLGENDHVVDREVLVKDEAGRKEKFRRRRVSATRDFPPHCGSNASSLANKEEHLRLIGDKNFIGIEKGGVESKEVETSKDAMDLKKTEKSALKTSSLTTMEGCLLGEAVVSGGEEKKGNTESNAVRVRVYEKGEGSARKEIVLCETVGAVDRRPSNDVFTSGHNEESLIVNALMAAPHCPWRQGTVASDSDAVKSGGRANKHKATWPPKSKAVAKKTTTKADSLERSSLKMDSAPVNEDADGTPGLPMDEEEYGEFVGPSQDLHSGYIHDVKVILPPYGPSSSSGDARNKVREMLRLFQATCRKLLQGQEAKMMPEIKRIDLEAAKIVKNKGIETARKNCLGAVPGVEVGDEFQYRVELAMAGVHRPLQAGIDFMKQNGMQVAVSIVSSGAYADDKEDADSLIYCGQGGNVVGKGKKPEDQKLERGNLALRNGITTKNPVRVILGSKETKASDSSDSRSKIAMTYVYDGLYTVENYWQEEGKHGNQVFMFKLKRIPGQPEVAWKEIKKSRKSKVRLGVCVDDIAGGKELIPICAVNTVNNEKPPPFSYITKMIYADQFQLLPSKGCDCTGRCFDSGKCSCALKNGGEIPYNHNGAIVEAKPLVYECGPSCRCPPSCYNRVSQHGIKIQLEVFKTETRGWGVRSLTSIPSGTFICEYVGELLEDKEAEKRKNDEYLFDIGQKGSDCCVNPDGQQSSTEPMEEVGYTIDAAYYGNVGRFINHSCSPNLYAQNVLHDHDDKRMPHIMLFAAENIPALKELTYHYNYSLNQVHDSDGNIRMKSCYCGSTECTGL